MTFRGLHPSEHVRALAEARFWKVRSQWTEMSRCDVVLERAHRQAQEAPRFSARVRLAADGEGLSASAEAQHENACAAVRDAFVRASSKVAVPLGHALGRPAPRAPILRLVR
jgi:hypothetical protein